MTYFKKTIFFENIRDILNIQGCCGTSKNIFSTKIFEIQCFFNLHNTIRCQTKSKLLNCCFVMHPNNDHNNNGHDDEGYEIMIFTRLHKIRPSCKRRAMARLL
jgi:hypothetical protein